MQLLDDGDQKRVANKDPGSYWIHRRRQLLGQPRNEEGTQVTLKAEDQTKSSMLEDDKKAWMRFLTERCGHPDMVLAAMAEGSSPASPIPTYLGDDMGSLDVAS